MTGWKIRALCAAVALAAWCALTGCESSGSSEVSSSAPAVPSKDASSPPPDPRWADLSGSESCRECHEDIFALWRNRDHGMAMLDPSAFSIRGDFTTSTLAMHDGSTARMFQKDGCWFIHCADAKEVLHDYRVDYTLGFEPIQQYMTRFPDGRIQVLPVTYDVMRKDWYELYAKDLADGDDFNFWEGLMQRWNYMCIDCHNTFAVKNCDPRSLRYDTRWFEINVGCEACHGAGKGHVALIKAGPGAVEFSQIADGYKGKEFTPAQALGNCGRCHARRRIIRDGFRPGDDFYECYVPELLDSEAFYPDGQIRDEDFEFTSFSIARMCAKGVRCNDCHDPHTNLRRREGNALCLECHQPYLGRFEHTMHKPESEGSRCERCHMPVTTYMGRDDRLDHGFSIPMPELTIDLGIPNACNRCHTDKGPDWTAAEMNRHYGQRKRIEHPFARAIAAGRTGRPEAVKPLARLAGDREMNPVVRASAASLLGRYTTDTARNALLEAAEDRHPLVAGMAIQGLSANMNASALTRIVRFLDDPRRFPRLQAIAEANRFAGQLTPEARERLDARWNEYVDWMRLQPDDPASHYNLGNFYADAGRRDEALKEYTAAESMGMEEVPLLTNLGMLLQAMGDIKGAEQQFLRLVAKAPAFAEGYFNLGLLYGEQPDRLSKAIENLRRATELKPDFARAHYNLGLAYNQAGRVTEAIQSLRKALQADPQLGEAAYALATIYWGKGDLARAADSARQALKANPSFEPAAQLLQEIESRANGGQ